MTRKSQGGLLLVILLAIFVVRCSLSIGFFDKHSHDYRNLKGEAIVVHRPCSPAPSPHVAPHLDNTSSTNANSSILAAYPPPTPDAQKVLKVDPVWENIVKLLKRPDVSKEASRAMEAGVQAWRELKKMMVVEASKRAKNSSHKEVVNRCPYSVSTLNATALKSQDSTLPIPCGLILDSSITIVGTPVGNTGEFAFELIGSKLMRGSEEPVVFHCSVRMRGDQKTNRPVIVHNTWTSDDDWHKEQRCPPLEDEEANPVDGLEICNAQIGQNVSRKGGPGLWKGLNVVEANQNSWFPFAEGFPFVATLMAGWDGFHFSVNGKHVSSFKYRQSLEPWMITKVRITGDLEVSSVIVNGLPISDDASLIPDLKAIKAPKLPKSIELFIGVFSTNTNFVQRMAIRRTWMQYPAVRNGTVAVRFFVGLHQHKQVNKELWIESLTYGDMQILPFVDYYNLITYKTLAICMFVTRNLKTNFLMKTDDDTFVRVDAVLSSIHSFRHNNSILLGNIEFSNKPDRDAGSKWYISMKEWHYDTYPPWAHGPGYIFSEDIARFIVDGYEKNRLKFFKLEDVAMGIWIDQFKKQKLRRVDYVNDENYFHHGCEEGYIIAHYQIPGQMQCLWNHVMQGEVAVCCNNDI